MKTARITHVLAVITAVSGVTASTRVTFAANPTPATKTITWSPNFTGATVTAKKQDKLVLAYFSGSDWDEWGKKLDKEVLRTDLFAEWVNKNVIAFQADFPAQKRQDLWKRQNEELKTRYQVSVVPIFLLLDGDGEVVARATYENLKLRPDEPPGQPKAAIEFLENVVKNRPETEKLVVQPTLVDTVQYATDHKLPVLLLLTKGDKGAMIAEAQKLLANQRFARWANVNVAFFSMKWPEPADKSQDATLLSALIARYKIGTTEAQLLMWLPAETALRSRITAFNTLQMEPLMVRLQKDLPFIPYKGTDWLSDIRHARAIVAQQPRRCVFLYFTDSSEFCQKFEKEILQTEEFTGWPFHAFVLVKLDYTKSSQRPKYLEDQNRELADLYGIRGYPTVILINPKGQKIGEGRYMKGGPKPFLEELKKVYNADLDRRLLFGQDQVGGGPPKEPS